MSDSTTDDRRVLCVGLVCLDIISIVRDYPLEDTDQRSLDYYWQRGGNASNSATVLALLGANVELMATLVKSQEYGFLQRDLASYGIKTDHCPLLEEGQYRCPVAIVVINQQNGSRTIMAALNHLAELRFEDFQHVDLSLYKWIHFEGRTNVSEMGKMMDRVEEYNQKSSQETRIKVSFEIEKAKRPELKRLIDKADIVFVSKECSQGQGFRDKEETVNGLIDLCNPGAALICAWGEDGAAARAKGCDAAVLSPVFPPEALVDTLGAGDSFIAATILALSGGKALKDSITFGCKVAGAKCGMKGKDSLKGMQSLLS